MLVGQRVPTCPISSSNRAPDGHRERPRRCTRFGEVKYLFDDETTEDLARNVKGGGSTAAGSLRANVGGPTIIPRATPRLDVDVGCMRCPRLFDTQVSNDKGFAFVRPRSDSVAIPAPAPNYPHSPHSRCGRHFTIYSSDGRIVNPGRFHGILCRGGPGAKVRATRARRPRLKLQECLECAFHSRLHSGWQPWR
jgi:hypothetical protein